MRLDQANEAVGGVAERRRNAKSVNGKNVRIGEGDVSVGSGHVDEGVGLGISNIV